MGEPAVWRDGERYYNGGHGTTGLMAGGNGTVSKLSLAQMRQHYNAAVVDSEEHAQRLLSLGVGAAAAVLLMTAPALGPALQVVWLGLCAGLAAAGIAFRRTLNDRLREALLEQQLQTFARMDRVLWDRIARMDVLPQPLDKYVEHFLSTYLQMKQEINEEAAVELGQVQLLQARDQVIEYIEVAEHAGKIRRTLDTMGHRLTDEDKIKLRQMFSDQCAGLQDLAQTFDRSLGNLMMAQVLGDTLGETKIEDLQERMREIEEEFEHVKTTLSSEI